MQKFILIVFFISTIVFAVDKVFIREYTYTAGDYDSKVTARTNALNQVSELLLREVGIYIKSETDWDQIETADGIKEVYKEEMDVITAGITKVEIIDEKWSWGEYWVQAKVTLNPKSVKKQIDAAVKNKTEYEEFKAAVEENERLKVEIEKLKNDDNLDADDVICEYNKIVNSLSFKEHFKLGKEHFKNKDFLLAKDQISECVNVNPEFGKCQSMLGRIYSELGQYNRAKKQYLKTIEKFPDNYWSYLGLGYLSSLDDDYESAYKYYNHANTLIPDNFKNRKIALLNRLSFICNQFKTYDKFNESEELSRAVLELDPENCKALINLAYRVKYFDRVKGVKIFEKAAQIGCSKAQKWLDKNNY